MKKISLLPGGAFTIHKSDTETIPGRFSMYVWDSFLEAEKKESMLDIENMLNVGMTLKQYTDLLKKALNDYDRTTEKFKRADVMDLIDATFPKGPADPELVELMMHGLGRIVALPDLPAELAEDTETEEEKKSE